MVWEKYKNYRNFGFMFSLIFLGISIWLFLKNENLGWWFAGTSGAFLLLALIYPPTLFPLYWIWMKVGDGLNWINSKIILGIIFYCLFTPIGIVLRIFKKDPLEKKIEFSSLSYWEERKPISDHESMKYQF